jgi:hypothetical protein
MDPRNVAHDKTVAQEKKKHHAAAVSDTVPHVQPGKKPKKGKRTAVTAAHAAPAEETETGNAGAADPQEPIAPQSAPPEPPPELEGALVVLAQLKDLAFHANAHQGRLAELMLTTEEKLKQKDFSVTIGDIYSAQADVHTRLTDLVTKYSAECDRLQVGG